MVLLSRIGCVPLEPPVSAYVAKVTPVRVCRRSIAFVARRNPWQSENGDALALTSKRMETTLESIADGNYLKVKGLGAGVTILEG